MILTYWQQLEHAAKTKALSLKQAFLLAGIPDSTYYRALRTLDIRLDTARRILAALQGRR